MHLPAFDMNAFVRAELRRTNWQEIGIRLTAYAARKLALLRWRSGRHDVMAFGTTAEDIAARALLKIVEGKRGWDPQREALLPCLRRVVDSMMDPLAEASDNRAWRRSENVQAVSPAAGEPPKGRRTGSACAAGESEDECAQRIETLEGALAHAQERELIAVIGAIRLHCEATPQAIALYLGRSVADVNVRLRRLRRFICAMYLTRTAPKADAGIR